MTCTTWPTWRSRRGYVFDSRATTRLPNPSGDHPRSRTQEIFTAHLGERQLKARVIDLPFRQDLLRVGATDDCKFLLPLHSQSLFQRSLGGHDAHHEQVVGTSAMGHDPQRLKPSISRPL